MLQRIRESVQGWIATFIFALLIIPFAFWGVNYYFEGGGEPIAARVNDDPVSLREYQRTIQTIRQRWQAVGGESPTLEQDGLIREQALNGLIERALLTQTADRLRLRVGDVQVREAIRGISAFQGFGGFDETMYQTTLASLGMTPAGFEVQMREDMRAEQVQSALVETGFVTDREVDRLLRVRNQTRDFRYAVMKADAAKETAEVTDAEVESWYREHPADYTEPARVRVGYLELSLDRIAHDLEVDEDAVRAWYQDNLGNFSVPEQRKLRQILVTVAEGATAEQDAAASARADGLRQQIVDGTPMDQVATTQAENPEAPVEFTEFGFLTPDVLEAEVEDVAFNLGIGEISQPVKSKFGYHVLEVTEIRPGTTPAFEEVREQVEEEFRHSQAGRRYAELADQLANLAFEHPDSLETAAESLELPIQQSDFFSREAPGTGILAHPELVEAAFSDEVLREGLNSDPIEVESGRLVALRVIEHVPQQLTPLDTVKDRIITRLKFEKGRRELEEKGRSVIAELQKGTDPESLAAQHGFTWEEAQDVRRDAANINRAVVRAAFRAGVPAGGATVFDGTSLGTGDFVVVAVAGVTDPDPASIPDEERALARKELLERSALRTWTRFLASSRSAADIQVFRDNLQ